ncbi:SusC/RagA family TonB-linked outer membrane protein [Pedobacter sp. HMF7647]|uniref:SusC/RagA family TonB-linked outer membrane protein n=1 Tax=Hufsiella arboris TaxID=2695275 RepID=A0A7K1YC32_9SPHI|nr:TonB-dependent receptor [Hufsiella arboris]MXV51649.1 SusC/RagA family TonB-linked outer membrane protein [Hufsiella arboris]
MNRKLLGFILLSFVFSLQSFAQKAVRGKVSAADDGVALPGVSVTLKGTNKGTQTGPEGDFTIEVPENSTLIFRSIGFETKEIDVKGPILNVSLKSESKQLSEVVVIGFGTQKRADLTGNVAQVKGADIADVPVANFTQAIQGRASGVMVEGQSGKVGGGIKLRIRGAGSISASNEPLYVVDGIPINTDVNTSGGVTGNALSDLNFDDVESFDILKDASAAAIYGSRGANGVVIITTKKGKSGKTNFSLDMQYGDNKPTNHREFFNAEQYVNYFLAAAENGAKYYWNRQNDLALNDEYTSEQEVVDDWVSAMKGRLRRYSGYSDYTTLQTNTDWESLAYNDKAHNATINLSASGGNEKSKFYTSGSYVKQDGILIGNNLERYTGRINFDNQASKIVSFGFNLGLSGSKTRRVQEDNEFSTPMQIVALSPITPVRNQNGDLYDTPTTTYYNPLIDYEDGSYYSRAFRNLGNAYAKIDFAKNLFFRSEFGVDLLNLNDDQYYGRLTQTGKSINGYGENNYLKSFNYNTNNYFNYHALLGSKHDIEGTLGMSYQHSRTDQNYVIGQDFPVDDLKKLASAGTITGGSSSTSEYAFLSYFLRGNYKFNDKYLLSVSGRVDGSSRFGNNNRYGFFPAVAAGWIMSNENFLKNNTTLSFLKLKGSYGLTGNADGIGNFPQLGLYTGAKYAKVSDLAPYQLANPDLKWEKSAQVDVGLEYGFINNRIYGEVDYYNKKTTDLLYSVPVPGTSGFSSIYTNIGSMKNYGVEFTLNTQNLVGKFRWSTSFNASYNRNEITKLDGINTIIPGNDGRYLNSLIVGEPIGVFYGPKYAGADPQNGDALYYKNDGSLTNDYNEAGDFVVGNPNPKWIGGMTNTFSYKGFELSVLLQGVSGNKIMNGAGGFMSANADWFDNQTVDQLNSWKKPGDVTEVPEARWNWSGSIPNGLGASNRYISDGSYLRFKTVNLGYSLPKSVASKLHVDRVRLYFVGQNLFTITNYDGWDPEVNTDYRVTGTNANRNQGSDFYSAPQIKSFTFGINLGF